jgi:hypothetical protein
MKTVKAFISQLFQDKNGSYSLREVVVLLFLSIIIVSWIARQFFQLEIPEFMFFAFVSIVTAGVFGYSLERRAPVSEPPSPEQADTTHP